MKYKLYVVFLILFTTYSLSYGLTANERKVVKHALEHIGQAKLEQIEAWNEAGFAWQKAYEADEHAKQTDAKLGTLGTEIETSHKNEQAMANQVLIYKPVYDQVRKYWGIGGIIYGFSLLTKHLLILTAVLIALGLILFVLSITVAPWLGPALKAVGNFFGMIFRKIADIFRRR